MAGKIIPLEMNAVVAVKTVQRLAEDTANIVLLSHTKKRMRQRRISMAQIKQCLRRGVIMEGPYMDNKGCWRCTMERLAAGEELRVVVAIDPKARLLIVSVF